MSKREKIDRKKRKVVVHLNTTVGYRRPKSETVSCLVESDLRRKVGLNFYGPFSQTNILESSLFQ